MVRYHVGPDSLSHDDFTRAVLATTGATDSPRFPGFSDVPLDAFRHLAQDLSRFGETFMSGTAEEFAVLVRWVEQHPRPRGLATLK